MSRRWHWAALTRFLAILIGLSLPLAILPVGPARAAPRGQAAELCVGASRDCKLLTDSWLRESASYRVTVAGNPATRVQVVVYLAVVEQNRLVGLRPISTGGDVTTGSQGVGQTTITIPPLNDQVSAGWALVSLGDVTGTDLSGAIGQFVPFGARQPTVLGDGFAEQKPAGQNLELHLVGAIPGTRFTVTYLDDSGVWRDITSATPQVSASVPDEVSIVHFTVPRGQLSTPHPIRLVNTSDTASSEPWVFIPAIDGLVKPRAAVFQPPPVGDSAATGAPATDFPARPVKTGLGIGVALIGVALLFAVPLRTRHTMVDFDRG